MEYIPKHVRFYAHGVPVTDEIAEVILRTRFKVLEVQTIEEGLVDIIHCALFRVPTTPDESEEGIFRTILRHWRN